MSGLSLDTIDIHSTDLYVSRGYPWPEWDLLRKEAPVFWYEREGIDPFWAITRHADVLTVSKRADVVNCSFGLSPSSFDGMSRHFRRELSRLCQTGGRRGKGLIMVFSAANDDAPTYLKPEDNVNGVLYTRPGPFGMTIAEIPAGRPVFSGYPMTPGVITTTLTPCVLSSS